MRPSKGPVAPQRGRQSSLSSLLTLALVAGVGFLVWHRAQRLHSTVERHLQNEEGLAGADHPTQPGASQQAKADPCQPSEFKPHTEYWGDVVVEAKAFGRDPEYPAAVTSEAECCRACSRTLGCNVWVWCSSPGVCQQQCWLKRVGKAEQMQAHAAGEAVPWTGGAVPKDYNRELASLPPVDNSIQKLSLTTSFGAIWIQLMPDWSETSVTYVRRLAAQPELCTRQCLFYRAEQGFLLQGGLHAFIPPNNITKPGPKIMERGDIGWAGGSAGPDFFIYLGAQPATHWNHDHTVWGKIADDASMAVVERIVTQPASAARPGDMHMLEKTVRFTTGK